MKQQAHPPGNGTRWRPVDFIANNEETAGRTLPKGDYINQGYCCYYGTCRRTFGANFLRSTTNFTSSK